MAKVFTHKSHGLRACVLSSFFVLLLAHGAGAQAPTVFSLTPARFEIAGNPGGKFSGTVSLINRTAGPLEMNIAIEDFVPQGEEGYIAVEKMEDASHSLSSWISPAVSKLTLPAGQTVPIDFKIAIPTDAEPGTHYGTILAQTTAESTGDALVVVKIGALVVADVYGDFKEELSLAEFQTPKYGWKFPLPFTVRFANSGSVRAKPQGLITISNAFGKNVVTIPLPERDILPGAVRRLDLPLEKGLLAGRYTAKVQATFGLKGRQTITAERTFWFVDIRRLWLPSLIGICALLALVFGRKRIKVALRVIFAGEGA